MRRLLIVLAIFGLMGGPLMAGIADVWVRQLQLDGYEEITVSRTWLGRMRIVAEKKDVTREIILNRSTGEVLRDYSRAGDGTLRLPLGFTVSLDDDDDNDHDDDDDDDRSGKSGKSDDPDDDDDDDDDDDKSGKSDDDDDDDDDD